MKEPEFKEVGTYADPFNAKLVAGVLQEHGIPAAIFNENTAIAGFVDYHGVKVKVNAEDYEEAMRILAASESAE